MQGSSRAAAAAGREALTGVLAAGADSARLGEELFAVVSLLDSSRSLRGALADPSREGPAKAGLVRRVLGGKVSAVTLTVVEQVAAQRWSSDRDLTDALESYAVESVIASAETSGRADRIEDELFRFERIVASSPQLRTALTDEAVPADRRLALADNLLAAKVAPETLVLARRAVQAARGRRFERTVEVYLETASRRREQQTAVVTSAVPLGDAERERLATALGRIYGGRVHVNTVVDPRVLGGVRVGIGEEVIDGTVLRRLDGVRRALDV